MNTEQPSYLVPGVGRAVHRGGRSYIVQETGAVIRGNPKPWRNKAERKRVRRERRQGKLI